MSVEENKALVRRWFEECLNKHDVDLADKMVASDFVRYGGRADEVHGLEAWKQLIRSVFDGMPDVHWTIEEMFAQGDRVAMRWTVSGTHAGTGWPGIPPTGNKITLSFISVVGVANGKIIEERSIGDSLDLWQQFGVIPPLEQMIEQYKSKRA